MACILAIYKTEFRVCFCKLHQLPISRKKPSLLGFSRAFAHTFKLKTGCSRLFVALQAMKGDVSRSSGGAKADPAMLNAIRKQYEEEIEANRRAMEEMTVRWFSLKRLIVLCL